MESFDTHAMAFVRDKRLCHWLLYGMGEGFSMAWPLLVSKEILGCKLATAFGVYFNTIRLLVGKSKIKVYVF